MQPWVQPWRDGGLGAAPTQAADSKADLDAKAALGAPPAPGHYRADIDGLRAVAVCAVVAYHVDEAAYPAGFAGVDVFFVVSGYVVVASLLRRRGDGPRRARGALARSRRRRCGRCLDELLDARRTRASGRRSGVRAGESLGAYYAAFYARRLQRLFPTLLVAVWASGLLVAAAAPRGDGRASAAYYRSAMVGLVGFSNVYYATALAGGGGGGGGGDDDGGGKGYFARVDARPAACGGRAASRATDLRSNPFMHTWSLDVEEQFSVVIPMVVAAAYGRRVVAGAGARGDGAALAVLAGPAVASLALCWYLTAAAPDLAFYLLPARYWELAAGALVFELRRRGALDRLDGACGAAALRAVRKSNLRPDFKVSVFERFDASSSALLRELDERNRFVQKSAESTSM
jgi:peptidoglycan/LPS O-acetylase OafA/YrhL